MIGEGVGEPEHRVGRRYNGATALCVGGVGVDEEDEFAVAASGGLALILRQEEDD